MAGGRAHALLDSVSRRKRPLIVGHRGSAGRFPENTLAAFRAGIEFGAEVIELDYHHSADGVPVVIHDPTLERTTNAGVVFGNEPNLVSDRTAAELATLDAGGNFDPYFKGESLPTLAQALELIQATSVTMIERKAGDAATLIRLLAEQGCLEDVVVQAFDWGFLREMRRLSHKVVLGALCNEELTELRIREAAAIGVEIITWKQEMLDVRGIELIHAARKQAWTYTVNEVERAKQLFAMEIDGLISNFPNEMVKLRNGAFA